MALDDAVLADLLDSDPSLRWRVERDLAGAPEAVWRATRARVAAEGFGARLLALQDPDGRWAGGAFFPGDFDFQGPEADEGAGQPYTATTWSLTALREWGVDAAALGDTAERLAATARWEYHDLPYWGGEADVCINAMTLANGAWLGVDVRSNAQWFLEHRMADGGWNCLWEEGATVSSFHSTLNGVTGLLEHEQRTGGDPALTAARHGAEEYLLARRLMFRLSTGERLDPWATRFAHPFRWYCSLIRALDHFRSAALHDGTAPDPRLGDAIDLLRSRRRADGTWLQEVRHAGRVWFETDAPPGEPSKALTLIGARVLDWWDAAR